MRRAMLVCLAWALLPLLDGVIIASALKQGGVWWNRVEEARVAGFMDKARAIRGYA